MIDTKLRLAGRFPGVSRREWSALVEREAGVPVERLRERRTHEGIEIGPLYTAEELPAPPRGPGLPGLHPFTRGAAPLGAAAGGWSVRTEHASPDPERAREEILRDVEGGVDGLRLRLDRGSPEGGLTARTVADLEALLAGPSLGGVEIELDAGGDALPAAALLVAARRSRLRGSLGADPLGALAAEGELGLPADRALRQLGDLACWTDRNLPGVTAVRVDTSPYHDAGATADLDLAIAMATGIEYLRAMSAAGLDVDRAARQITFTLSVGCRFYLATAKLRAARRLWARVVEASGGAERARALRLTVRPARRVLTARDPWVNLLRNTACCFAGALGGAEAVIPVAYDAALGLPGEPGRRVARNTPLILREEAQLHRVVDPAGGSWLIESWTEALAERAWAALREIEREGGLAAALADGPIARRIDEQAARRAEAVAHRRETIVGVSEFADPGERRPEVERPDPEAARRAADARLDARAPDPRREPALGRLAALVRDAGAAPGELTGAAVEAAAAGASLGELGRALGFAAGALRAEPLRPRPLAVPFEALRDRSDALAARRGARPQVFLVKLGPPDAHHARADFSRRLFRSAGFDVVAGGGFEDAGAAADALAQSGARIAVICSSDARYPAAVPELAPRLRRAGARTVVLAGRPGEHEAAWREAGVDRFVFAGCNALETLAALVREEETE